MSTMTETTTPDRPEWLEQGAEVGVISGGYAQTATTETVERFTKTQVVLTNGDRYSLNGLERRVGGRGAMGATATLVPLDDPRFRRMLAQQSANRCAARVWEEQRRWSGVVTKAQADAALKEAEALVDWLRMLRDEAKS
jgi:hypothetical protein